MRSRSTAPSPFAGQPEKFRRRDHAGCIDMAERPDQSRPVTMRQKPHPSTVRDLADVFAAVGVTDVADALRADADSADALTVDVADPEVVASEQVRLLAAGETTPTDAAAAVVTAKATASEATALVRRARRRRLNVTVGALADAGDDLIVEHLRPLAESSVADFTAAIAAAGGIPNDEAAADASQSKAKAWHQATRARHDLELVWDTAERLRATGLAATSERGGWPPTFYRFTAPYSVPDLSHGQRWDPTVSPNRALEAVLAAGPTVVTASELHAAHLAHAADSGDAA